MLKVPAMILGVKGASNQQCIGGGRGMREFAGGGGGRGLQKCPKTFGQDCRCTKCFVFMLFSGCALKVYCNYIWPLYEFHPRIK